MTAPRADWRGAPTIPVILQPPHNALPPPPTLHPACVQAVDDVIALLGRFRDDLAAGRAWDREPMTTLVQAARAQGIVVRLLAPHLRDVDVLDTTRTPAPHDHYMGVRRAALTPEENAAEVAVVLERALTDLTTAPIHHEDAGAETRAIMALLTRMRSGGRTPAVPAAPAAGTGASRTAFVPSGDGLERWILVHHLYGLFLAHAAAAVHAATRAVEADRTGIAVTQLCTATVHARGATAAMFHAGATSAHCYDSRIRPTMRPPATPMPLGGSMNPENAVYRRTMRRFLHALPGPYAHVAERSEALARARDKLLETDLLDIERHVAVAALLVGDERSILQGDDSQDNAVSALRRMHAERARTHGPLLRHPVWTELPTRSAL